MTSSETALLAKDCIRCNALVYLFDPAGGVGPIHTAHSCGGFAMISP
jgi:hypothetical protein